MYLIVFMTDRSTVNCCSGRRGGGEIVVVGSKEEWFRCGGYTEWLPVEPREVK